jgi:hypothetical protein
MRIAFTRTKLCVAAVSFSVTVGMGLLLVPRTERFFDHFGSLLAAGEPATPPTEEWPKLQLVVDPTLHCTTPATCAGCSHLGSRVAPFSVASLFWRFDAVLATNGRRFVRMKYADGFTGERFELAFIPAPRGAFEVGVLGRSHVDSGPPFTSVLQGLTGTVTVNTLDWREHEPIHVRFELRYFYDDDPAKWSTIEVCSEATPTRGE